MTKRTPPAGGFSSATLRTLVGSTFLAALDTPDDPPLRIGRQTWSAHALATRLGVVHTRAARLLTAAAKSIDARTVADLYKRSTPYTFAGIPGFGTTTMYVLWRLFESEGLDPDRWASAGDSDDALVSFVSLKHREQHVDTRTRDDARRRTGRRTATLRELDAAADDSARRRA